MVEENLNKEKKQGQYGSGTQEREQNITGSSGVQNRQGQNINQGSVGGQKGGQGLGQPNQNRPQGNMQGERQQGNMQGQQQGKGFGVSKEKEEEE